MTGSTITLHCSGCQTPILVPVSWLGRTIACHRCATAIVIVATTPLPPPLPPGSAVTPVPEAKLVPQPPPLPEALPVSVTAEQDAEESTEETESSVSNAFLWGTLLIGLVASFSIGIFGAVGIALWFSGDWSGIRKNNMTSNAEQDWRGPIAPGDLPTLRNSLWTNASTHAIGYAGVSVRIEGAAIMYPRFESRGENLTTTQRYLVVHVSVTNRQRDLLKYKSWYSYQFEDAATSQTIAAECEILHAEKLKLFPIPGADRVERHIRSDYDLEKGDSISDSLVFQFPKDTEIDLDLDFRLTLPAEALENQGEYRFILPATMIKRYDDATEIPPVNSADSSEEVPREP